MLAFKADHGDAVTLPPHAQQDLSEMIWYVLVLAGSICVALFRDNLSIFGNDEVFLYMLTSPAP